MKIGLGHAPLQGVALPAEGADSASTRDRRGTVVEAFSYAVAAIYRPATVHSGSGASRPGNRAKPRPMVEHSIPEPLLTRIGDITVSFATLELQMQLLIDVLLVNEIRVTQIVTAELPFRALLPLATSLYRERHGEDADFDELREVLKRVEKVEQDRNLVMHSTWAIQDDGTIALAKTTARLKRGLHVRIEPMGAAELKEIAEDVRQVGDEIFMFMTKVARKNEQ